jgi:sulfate adenylyltransferase subunit 1
MPAPLRLVVAGSVDDGKSTLVGRLLLDTKSILADQHEAIERVSRSRGASAFDLALLTDGLRAEREQGITIDVAYRYFETPRRSFILADTPGHVQYTRNTVTGASTADVAVILVDARNGVVDQTRRHGAVMALLGVPHLIFAVNKMDAVGWDEDVFGRVAADARALAESLGRSDVQVLPISALTGENVVDRGSSGYPGPALLPLLESLDPAVADELDRSAFRAVIIRPRTAEHPDYRGLAGRVVSGAVSVGDAVVALPSGLTSTVSGIDTPDGPVEMAVSGQSVTVHLSDELDVGRGEVLAHPSAAPRVSTALDGIACWLASAPSSNQRVGQDGHSGSEGGPGSARRSEARLRLVGRFGTDANEIGRVAAGPAGGGDLRGRPWHRCLRDRPANGALAAGMVES